MFKKLKRPSLDTEASSPIKIVMAVGGSGGHLFPAQAFAAQYLKEREAQIIFAGAHLSKNRYFDRSLYQYRDISSETPFGGVKRALKSIWSLTKGIRESMQFLKEFSPDIIVGFGSFHAFPLLLAAVLLRRPFVLFESNQIPGKVTRFFSRFAKSTALYLPGATRWIRGPSELVSMPTSYKVGLVGQAEARNYFKLDEHLTTLLVFGGSQGASSINQLILKTLPLLDLEKTPFQVLHLVGKEGGIDLIEKEYQEKRIPACVLSFEKRMDMAYTACDLALSRSGAATLAELIAFKVPSIVIPYPYASDGHQVANAQFLQNWVNGGIYFEEKSLTIDRFARRLTSLLESSSPERIRMLKALESFENEAARNTLITMVEKQIYDK